MWICWCSQVKPEGETTDASKSVFNLGAVVGDLTVEDDASRWTCLPLSSFLVLVELLIDFECCYHAIKSRMCSSIHNIYAQIHSSVRSVQYWGYTVIVTLCHSQVINWEEVYDVQFRMYLKTGRPYPSLA